MMPTIIKTTTMQEIIEDAFGEVDIDDLSFTGNITHIVGYRRAESSQFVMEKPEEPYGEWVWISRYQEDE